VSAALGADTPRYRINSGQTGLSAVNPEQRLRIDFAATGLTVRVGTASVGLDPQAIGYGSALRPLGRPLRSARGNRVSYTRPRIGEWYVNGPLGLEQGFTIDRALTAGGSGALTVAIGLHGNARAVLSHGHASVTFRRAGRSVLEYGGLHAVDRAGRTLPSRLELDGHRLLLHVDAAGARYPLTIDPLIQQGEKLTGGAEGVEGLAGWTVALSADGNTALIGGPGDEGQTGAAWVFTRSGSTWTQQGPKLTASGESPKGAFGVSVALSGDGNTALIGASADKFLGEAQQQLGSVRVFTRSESSWTETQKLEAGVRGANDEFGTSVAISSDGSTAAIGAPADEAGDGAVWVFKRPASVWSLTVGLDTCEEREFPSEKCIKREEETGAGQFGDSVALSSDGKTILIGGPADNANAGAAWVYEKVAEGVKGFEYQPQGGRKTPTGNIGISAFGTSVALSADGNTALIGGSFDNAGDGAAWVLTRSGFTWTQQGPKLTETGGLAQSDFGASVALSADGNTALIGAPEEEDPSTHREEVGSAWELTRSGSTWSQRGGKLIGAGAQLGEVHPIGAAFGNAVALSSDASTALIGGFLDHDGRGAAWVFSSATGPPKEVPPSVIPPVELIKGGGVGPGTKFTTAQIAALLAGGLVPSGKAAKISALLKHGGFTIKLRALEAGSATIDWYQLPRGAKLARRTKPKPVLVAAGHLGFAAAGTGVLKLKLTSAGRKLLKHAGRLKLTALGSFTPAGGTAVKATRTVLLKR